MGWWIVFGGIWMLVFWGVVIALVVWGIKKLTEHGSRGSRTGEKPDPLDIAKERYAKGEISKVRVRADQERPVLVCDTELCSVS
jgi:putative membrane protein